MDCRLLMYVDFVLLGPVEELGFICVAYGDN